MMASLNMEWGSLCLHGKTRQTSHSIVGHIQTASRLIRLRMLPRRIICFPAVPHVWWVGTHGFPTFEHELLPTTHPPTHPNMALNKPKGTCSSKHLLICYSHHCPKVDTLRWVQIVPGFILESKSEIQRDLTLCPSLMTGNNRHM